MKVRVKWQEGRRREGKRRKRKRKEEKWVKEKRIQGSGSGISFPVVQTPLILLLVFSPVCSPLELPLVAHAFRLFLLEVGLCMS